jgi:choline dehydrogenase-like flavoprotein
MVLCPRMNARHMAEEPDVVVIGGGPGGSTLATLVAMRGHHVVLLESDPPVVTLLSATWLSWLVRLPVSSRGYWECWPGWLIQHPRCPRPPCPAARTATTSDHEMLSDLAGALGSVV